MNMWSPNFVDTPETSALKILMWCRDMSRAGSPTWKSESILDGAIRYVIGDKE